MPYATSRVKKVSSISRYFNIPDALNDRKWRISTRCLVSGDSLSCGFRSSNYIVNFCKNFVLIV